MLRLRTASLLGTSGIGGRGPGIPPKSLPAASATAPRLDRTERASAAPGTVELAAEGDRAGTERGAAEATLGALGCIGMMLGPLGSGCGGAELETGGGRCGGTDALCGGPGGFGVGALAGTTGTEPL